MPPSPLSLVTSTVSKPISVSNSTSTSNSPLHGQQALVQVLSDLLVVFLDLRLQSVPHPLAQTHIAAAVLNEAGTLAAPLLALDLGENLGAHGGFRCLSVRHQPSFLQRLLGDLPVVHRLLVAELLKHLLSAIGKGKAATCRGRSWSLLAWTLNRRKAALPKREGLRADLYKGGFIAILLDIRIESCADSGFRCLAVTLPEVGF